MLICSGPTDAGLRQRAAAIAGGTVRTPGGRSRADAGVGGAAVCFNQNCYIVHLPITCRRYSAESGQLVLGEGAFRLHVAEVNAVVHI